MNHLSLYLKELYKISGKIAEKITNTGTELNKIDFKIFKIHQSFRIHN